MSESVCFEKSWGFSLIEMMVALTILTLGLLAVGPLLYIAASSDSLARSKSAAAVAAQNTLEYLADLYGQNPSAADLTLGSHGPQQIQVANPIDGTVLNRYDIVWVVSSVSDPRPGKVMDARLVTVRITPIQLGGARNDRPRLNKTLNVTTIVSPMMR